MRRDTVALREETMRVLDQLTQAQLAEVLDFALFLQDRIKAQSDLELKTIPASSLEPLIGIVSLGGDALEDSERIWDESEE